MGIRFDSITDDLVTCPCCGGGIDIIAPQGARCDLCGVDGQVPFWEAGHFEETIRKRDEAMDRLKSPNASAFDVLGAAVWVPTIRG